MKTPESLYGFMEAEHTLLTMDVLLKSSNGA